MSEPMSEPKSVDEPDATATVRRKAALMAKARREPSTFWRSLANIGVLGWLFVIPLVSFALLGHFLAKRWSEPALGIGGLLFGLAISLYVTGRAVRRAMDEVEQDRADRAPSKRDPSKRDPSKRDPSKRDPSKRDPSNHDAIDPTNGSVGNGREEHR